MEDFEVMKQQQKEKKIEKISLKDISAELKLKLINNLLENENYKCFQIAYIFSLLILIENNKIKVEDNSKKELYNLIIDINSMLLSDKKNIENYDNCEMLLNKTNIISLTEKKDVFYKYDKRILLSFQNDEKILIFNTLINSNHKLPITLNCILCDIKIELLKHISTYYNDIFEEDYAINIMKEINNDIVDVKNSMCRLEKNKEFNKSLKLYI